MNTLSEENTNSRTLYVGNLDSSVSEELLMALFTQIGRCVNCKIIHESTSDPYAFIEFAEHQAAAHALLAMNKRLVMGKEIKVNWATTSTNTTSKVDTSKHHHIFVGDLAPEVDQNTLHEAFSPFGEISEIKFAKFPDTQKSKGYCFIAFTNQNDADTAITSMNGQWLGTRRIRTNWAVRKAPTNEAASNTRQRDPNSSHYGQESSTPKLDYNEVWNRTGETNSTVYFGGCADVNEDLVRSIFAPFGHIQEIRVFKEKGYAFVRFASKESACQAICRLHGSELYGSTIKCSWGRDESNNDRSHSAAFGNNYTHTQTYSNNQYDSYSHNSYGPSSNNNYMGSSFAQGNDRRGYGNYDGSFQQQYNTSQQWTPNNNNNGAPWNSYSQYMGDARGNGRNNDYYDNQQYEPNYNGYNNPPQSHMYPSNSGWGSSRR